MNTIQGLHTNTQKNIVNTALFEGLTVDELLTSAEDILNSNAAYAYMFAEQAEMLAQELSEVEKIARAKSIKGASLYKQDKPKEALQELSTALTFAESSLLTCEISNRMAYCHSVLSEYKMTILLSKEVLKLLQGLESTEAKRQKVFSYNCVGIAYFQLGVYDLATNAFLNGLEIVDKSDSQNKSLNTNLSMVHQKMGDLDKAFRYNKKALELSVEENDRRQEALNLGNRAYLFLSSGNYLQVINFAEQALAIQQASLDAKLLQFDNLARAYIKIQEYLKAEQQIIKAKNILEEFPNDYRKCEILYCEAELYVSQDKFQRAEQVLLKVKDLSFISNNLEILYQTHAMLSDVYEILERYDKALEHQRLFHNIKTQVYNEKAESRVEGLMIQHEVEELVREKEQTFEENLRLEQLVHQRTVEIEEAHMEMLERLAIAGEKRDDDTGEHTARVGRVCALIAREMGCDDMYVDTIKMAARLHDLGKIGVPDSILLKPNRLTEAEFEIVKTHAAIGAEMLTNSKSKLFQMAERIAGTHHEHWNGGGYPKGISGEDIPLEGRIVAVADVYDALTNDRPYKSTWTHEEAMAELIRSADSHLDRNVVDAFTRLFEKGIINPADLREKPKKKAKIYDAYDQEIFAKES